MMSKHPLHTVKPYAQHYVHKQLFGAFTFEKLLKIGTPRVFQDATLVRATQKDECHRLQVTPMNKVTIDSSFKST
jgi:hypothetical protein